MAFDAGMISAIVNELNATILGSKIDKVYQPEKDELVLGIRRERDNVKLSIAAGANNPKINLTNINKENPKVPYAFCMLMRKHLIGAKIIEISQLGFERAIQIEFEAYDAMGFLCKKYLIAEIMGKYSNIIFCNDERKIIHAVKIIDFTTSQKRQVLPGMIYELPPLQDKRSPLEATEHTFKSVVESYPTDLPVDRFIMSEFLGISSLVAREIAFSTTKACDTSLGNCDIDKLWFHFNSFVQRIKNKNFTPTLIKDLNGKPIEYCFFPIRQYLNLALVSESKSFSDLIDDYFTTRDKTDRIKQRATDILKLLTNAENRLNKKISLQKADIQTCADKDKYKLWGDIITSNMYLLERGMEKVKLVNYYSDDLSEVEITLDNRLTPSQNAQKLYKKYNKAKIAEVELTNQIEIAQKELDYIYTVFDSLTKAETENDLNEIRQELYLSGYASRMKNYSVQKLSASKPLEFKSESGYRILCGKNNHQNDYITTKVASKLDYWFHVKNIPGSHTVMVCNGEEPSEIDFTQAATIAAYYSKAKEGQNIAVDYTLIKNVKKPSGSKPGFVIYNTNWTAYVTPNDDFIKSLK